MHWFWRAAIAVAVGVLCFLVFVVVSRAYQTGNYSLANMRAILQRMIWNVETLGIAIVLIIPGLATYGLLTYYYGPHTENETRCRKCGYILRGIPEPRCSECGERI